MEEDMAVTTLLHTAIRVSLYTDGPAPGPNNAIGDFTLAAGTNSKTPGVWVPRLVGQNPYLTSPTITFVPGTDVDVGQTVKGFVVVDTADPVALVGSEAFPGEIALNTALDVLLFNVNVEIPSDIDLGKAVII